MPAPFTPLAVANCFLEKFGADADIEHMKLQKLVYCAYGWWLAARGQKKPRLTSEAPEVWRYGPVFDSLYHCLKIFGRDPIKTPQSINPFQDAENIPEDATDKDATDARKLIDWIWERYGHLSSLELSAMTHEAGSPWHKVATENKFRVPFNTPVPDQYIFEEFTKLPNAAKRTAELQQAAR